MALPAGTRLGSYEITGQLGVGGMGEVYRATDTKLGREVAIKTLPTALAKDPDRLARFEREAKLLAALNHAHIASIYGLHEHEGTQFLAMELVEGETLEAKLKAGAPPLEDALGTALQIAEALEAAHDKGVVHRDLKPANVMITRDGVVKVLDFGLAKAFSGNPNEASPTHSPALSMAMTQQGLILGTAGYMSPEQASGKATDQRADIWAFGVVLYEMLTGLPLFSGESVPHILADVLRSEPDWSRLPKSLHPRLKLLLERCLEKKARNRCHSIADVRVDIEKVLSSPEAATAVAATARPTWAWTRMAATGLVAALLAAALVWTATRPPPPRVSRLLITPPATAPLASVGGYDLAISPDGARLAYVARNLQGGAFALYLRDLDELEARLMPGTEHSGSSNPFFSADGAWIIYWPAGEAIMRVAVSGGPPLEVVADPGGFLGGTGARDGTLIYSGGDALYRVSAGGGGTPERLTPEPAPGTPQYIGPVLLPGERAVLFAQANQRVAVLNLETREETILIEGGQNPTYAETGHIVFARGTTLMAVPFDVERLAVTGDPVALFEGVRRSGDAAADYALSATGTLAYVPGTGEEDSGSDIVWVDRTGRVAERALAEPVLNARNPRLSPDGSRLVLTTGLGITQSDLWIYDLGGRPPIPLADEGNSGLSVWSPDGMRIAFSADRGNGFDTFIAAADGSVLDPPPLRSTGLPGEPAVWSAEGDLILIQPGPDIVATPAAAEGAVRNVVVTDDQEFDPALAPNGRWLAYASNRTGRPEVWVKGYPDGVPIRISRSGGEEPVWSTDGRELFYLQGNAMMAVAVETGEEFSFGAAVELFSGPYLTNTNLNFRTYDVARDGRFLMFQPQGAAGDAEAPTSIVVVQNWFEELKRRVPVE